MNEDMKNIVNRYMINCKTFQKILLHLIIAGFMVIPVSVIARDMQPKKIIYETDMCADVDDAGGLAVLHALANKGEAEILAVCFNEVHPYGAPAIDAMNTWYGRGDIPIGIYKGHLDNPHGSGYLEYVAKFPHDLETADAPSALDVYRQVLAEQPDSSVTIVSVGFLNNINDLLIAEPDLVARKVVELVQMAGVYNDGFNLVQHNLVSVSENVIRNWPTPLVISQEGSSIHTGDNYKNAAPENPFREAFYRYFGEDYQGRPSWDEMAVLYGVYGLSPYFNMVPTGTGRLSNGYTWDMQPGFRTYLSNRYPNPTYERIIESLMNQLPIGAHFNVSANTGWIPFSVDFDASTSVVEGNRTVVECLWDFGDGSSGEGITISHEYTTSGAFQVQLTIIDSANDTLRTVDSVYTSNPLFSTIPYYGNAINYQRVQEDLWSTSMDSGDYRYYLNNNPRNAEVDLAGFSFIKDSIYTDFSLFITTRTAEDFTISSSADYSVIFGYTDENNYNQLLMSHSSARVTGVVNGISLYIAGTGRDGIPDDHYHDLNVVLKDDQLSVFLDDSLFLNAGSSKFIKTGKIGFGSENYGVYFDDISVIGGGFATGIDNLQALPDGYVLRQNYPNPFNPITKIGFYLPQPENVVINIYNNLGQKLRVLKNQPMSPGYHEVVFSAEDLSSGIYFYSLEAGGYRALKKMVVLK